MDIEIPESFRKTLGPVKERITSGFGEGEDLSLRVTNIIEDIFVVSLQPARRSFLPELGLVDDLELLYVSYASQPEPGERIFHFELKEEVPTRDGETLTFVFDRAYTPEYARKSLEERAREYAGFLSRNLSIPFKEGN